MRNDKALKSNLGHKSGACVFETVGNSTNRGSLAQTGALPPGTNRRNLSSWHKYEYFVFKNHDFVSNGLKRPCS